MTSKLKVEQIAHTNNVSAMTIDSTGGVSGIATTKTEVATTSGTFKDITVPSTAKIIYVGIMGFSHSGSTANQEIQLGTSGGIVTSGYQSTALYLGGGHNSGGANVTTTDSFAFAHNVGVGSIVYGLMTIASMGGNQYCFSSNVKIGAYINWGAGYVSLGGAVTTIRIQTDSGQTLDAGSFNVTYIE